MTALNSIPAETVTLADSGNELSLLVITLLKGVLYCEQDARLWGSLLRLQARVRDYISTLGLELVLDEAEGYAFLRSRPLDPDDEASSRLPRLMARRQLSFPVSLLLSLLRKKLAEFDARGSDTRLVLSRLDIVDLIRVFLPAGSNDAKLVNQVDATINKIVELGFLRRLKSQGVKEDSFEVRRILKAFVDAQWLAELDSLLAKYQEKLVGDSGEGGDE